MCSCMHVLFWRVNQPVQRIVTCKMQNRNATDKLNPQCSKLALFANTITEICGRITMLVYYIVDLAYQVYFAFCK